MQTVVLIDGRFELLNSPDCVDVYDVRVLKKDGDGRVIPVHAIPLENPVNDREAGKLALSRLLDSGYLTQSEYFHFADIFLAAQPVSSGT
jgi:hypothetical protein